MKKIAMLTVYMLAATAFAQEALQFNLTLAQKGEHGASGETNSLMIVTVPGSEGIFTNMTEAAIVNEVNSHYGQVQLKPVKIQTGVFGKVQYIPTKEANLIDVAIEYEWVERSVVVSKGQHMVKAKVGDTITLPGANRVEVKLAVKPQS